MTPEELLRYRTAIFARTAKAKELLNGFLPAPSESESDDKMADAVFEALFLRQFVEYERDLESLFLHYLTGGASLGGEVAPTYLSVADEELARSIVQRGWRFLSWSNPEAIRDTAKTYLKEGWPINEMMIAKGQDLADCRRIRNRICHNSGEAQTEFDVVQRNLFRTERNFSISPGQVLRVRSARLKKFHIEHYLDAIKDTLIAILDPPS